MEHYLSEWQVQIAVGLNHRLVTVKEEANRQILEINQAMDHLAAWVADGADLPEGRYRIEPRGDKLVLVAVEAEKDA